MHPAQARLRGTLVDPESRTLYRRHGFATDREILVLRSPRTRRTTRMIFLSDPGRREDLQGST